MDSVVKTVSVTAVDDVEFSTYAMGEAVAALLTALERARNEICLALGAPAYAWGRTIPPDVAAALDEIEREARALAVEARSIRRLLTTAGAET